MRAAAGLVVKIGLLSDGLVDWMGGIGLLRLVARGLGSMDEVDHPTAILYLSSDLAGPPRSQRRQSYENALAALGLAPYAQMSRSVANTADVEEWFADHPVPLTLVPHGRRREDLLHALHDNDCEVVLPAMRSLGHDFPLPWIGYLYDFQHRYLPQHFSGRARIGRNLAFGRLLREADVVIVNARSVSDDIERFYPRHRASVVVLPFAPDTRPEWWALNSLDVCAQYGLPERFFLVCNQFWVHKDHGTAIRALAQLHAETGCRDVALVCTGKPHDYRVPGHFEQLKEMVRSLGLESSVRFLGVIPKVEQIAVMRSALAVVQPSLFEGGPGGGAGNDAIAVGTPLIASDIPVNRELDIGDVSYFAPRAVSELAARMAASLSPGPRPTLVELSTQSDARLALLGARLGEAIDIAMTEHHSDPRRQS